MDKLLYQTAIFFQKKQARPDELWYKFSVDANIPIDRVPIIMPLPEEAPDELPIVSFASTDGLYSINISRSRADFIINLDGKQPLEEAKVRQLGVAFAKKFSSLVDVKRVGIVGKFVLEDENNVERINNTYFNSRFEHAVELSMRVNNRETYQGFSLNNITDIQTIEGKKDNKTVKGILVLRDINNVDSHMVMSSEKVEKLVEFAFDYFTESKVKEWI